jgi:tRNA-specific 2-thiouridylase
MKKLDKNKIVVAMSGGVDSSVVAVLLKKEGYDVIGVTIKTWGYMEDERGAPIHENACCSLDAVFDAKAMAKKYDFPHYVVDFTQQFEKEIIENFVEEYFRGRTPNPCVLCNKKIKWEELLKKADELGAFYIATGHYAKIEYKSSTGRYALRKSADARKDQTYALWGLSQESLERTILPLGNYTKEQVREMAEEFELIVAKKPDSMEICFVPDNDYANFLRKKEPQKFEKIGEGDLIYKGKIVGKHKGYPNYTIGQRKGLGVALGKPVYVKRIDPERNIVEVGDKEDLLSNKLIVRNINYVSVSELKEGQKVFGKIRYLDKATAAEIIYADKEKIEAAFYEPKSAITPGQSAVFYDEEGYLLAGGIIDSTENP